MFGPWITVVMLALESSEVIGLRVAKLAGGGELPCGALLFPIGVRFGLFRR